MERAAIAGYLSFPKTAGGILGTTASAVSFETALSHGSNVVRRFQETRMLDLYNVSLSCYVVCRNTLFVVVTMRDGEIGRRLGGCLNGK